MTWASSDTTKAVVSSTGLATSVSVGSAIITATSEGKRGTATVAVVARFAILPNPIVLAAGSTDNLIYVVERDSHGTRVFYDPQQLTLVSSDSSVAAPSVGGCVDGDCGIDHLIVVAGRAGTATITATLIAPAHVTVNAALAGTIAFTSDRDGTKQEDCLHEQAQWRPLGGLCHERRWMMGHLPGARTDEDSNGRGETGEGRRSRPVRFCLVCPFPI